MIAADKRLRTEMLAAFLGIEDQGAHVETRRERMRELIRPELETSIRLRRAMFGATGVPEPGSDPEAALSIVASWVDDPSMTPAELYHRLDRERERAQKDGRKPNLTVGKVIANVNLRGLMGGFCRFHGTEAQQKACVRLKSLYERSQVGGAKAVDPSLEPVDGGGINPETNIQIGADARKEYASVASLLGKQDMARIEFVVIRERGPTPYAIWRGFGDGGRGISRGMVEVRGIADRLAEHWQFQTRRAA